MPAEGGGDALLSAKCFRGGGAPRLNSSAAAPLPLARGNKWTQLFGSRITMWALHASFALFVGDPALAQVANQGSQKPNCFPYVFAHFRFLAPITRIFSSSSSLIPLGPKDGPKTASRRPQDGPRRAKMGPRWLQDDPKTAQDRPKKLLKT